jgi:hypothetical protein
MSIEQPGNLSYLLHLWQVERNGEPVWWASLDNPRTGERQIFADLAELFIFLDEKAVHCHPQAVRNDLNLSRETETGLDQPVNNTHLHYLSYLLRLLRVGRENNPAWRVSLQSIHTTERLNFKDLETFTDYLVKKMLELDD